MHSAVYSLSISDHNLSFAIRKIGIPRRSPRYFETGNFKKFNANAFLSDIQNLICRNLIPIQLILMRHGIFGKITFLISSTNTLQREL